MKKAEKSERVWLIANLLILMLLAGQIVRKPTRIA